MSTITVEGNLAEDPRVNFTQAGQAVANLTLLENHRVQNAEGEWADATPTRHQVVIWGPMGEHAGDSLTKGSRVLVTGSLYTDQWADENGEVRYTTKIKAQAIGISLRFAGANAHPKTQQAPAAGEEQARQG